MTPGSADRHGAERYSCDSTGSQLITRDNQRLRVLTRLGLDPVRRRFALQPAQPAAVVQCQPPAVPGVSQAKVFVPQLCTQHRIVEQHTHFSVQVGRARVQVEGADEAAAVIDQECLGVQARAAAAEHAGIAGLSLCLQLVQVDAGFQQRHAVAHVAPCTAATSLAASELVTTPTCTPRPAIAEKPSRPSLPGTK